MLVRVGQADVDLGDQTRPQTRPADNWTAYRQMGDRLRAFIARRVENPGNG